MENTNERPVSQKQLDYIAILKEKCGGETPFLYGEIAMYKRMEQKGKLPDGIYGDFIDFGSMNLHERMRIDPDRTQLTPKDLMEMKQRFDEFIMSYEPKTTKEASFIIDILKGGLLPEPTNCFIYDWVRQHYNIEDELRTEGSMAGVTIHHIVSKK